MAIRRFGDMDKVWTISEAKARLSEILRLAESEGPQRIGVRKSFVITPQRDLEGHQIPDERMPIGQYLLEKMPRDIYSDEPHARGAERPIPFVHYATDVGWADDEEIE